VVSKLPKPICASVYTPAANWTILKNPGLNCAMLIIPYANWPMAITPLAWTGMWYGLYLKRIRNKERPSMLVSDLY